MKRRKKKNSSSVVKSAQAPLNPGNIAISVVVSLYNYEEYIGECLDSILNQTLQNFEVIVVDDCSTDNGLAVAKSYITKFDGRLKVLKTPTNTGGGGIPRNMGFNASKGEYVFFMDADDALTLTGLEEMYTPAKEYQADVVYCEKYYMSEGIGQEFKDNAHIADGKIQNPPFVDKPTLETEDMEKRIQKVTERNYWPTAWLRLAKRDFLQENNIKFLSLIGSNDVGWVYQVLFCAKRFLRIPNICYIRRIHNKSVSFRERTTPDFVHKWLDRSVRSLKYMDDFMKGVEFFRKKPSFRYKICKSFLNADFSHIVNETKDLSENGLYDIVLQEFGDYLGKNDILVSALCSALFGAKKLNANAAAFNKIKPNFTARVELKLPSAEGEFEIVSVSDDNAAVTQPPFLQKDGMGYVIESFAGDMTIAAKSNIGGKIRLWLKGLQVQDPKNHSKKIPCHIDFTALSVNDKAVFSEITPVRHDKPYVYDIEIKADEEIKIYLEWLPHLKAAGKAPLQENSEEILAAKLQEIDTLKKMLTAKLQELDSFKEMQRILTAGIDIGTIGSGDIQILSVSDAGATVTQSSAFIREGGAGYIIESATGEINIVTSINVDGEILLALRGMEVRDPKDNSKRIPYRIDFTSLTVNGKIVFDKPVSVCYEEPYICNINVKAEKEVRINLTWHPHSREITNLKEINAAQAQEIYKLKELQVAQLREINRLKKMQRTLTVGIN